MFLSGVFLFVFVFLWVFLVFFGFGFLSVYSDNYFMALALLF